MDYSSDVKARLDRNPLGKSLVSEFDARRRPPVSRKKQLESLLSRALEHIEQNMPHNTSGFKSEQSSVEQDSNLCCGNKSLDASSQVLTALAESPYGQQIYKGKKPQNLSSILVRIGAALNEFGSRSDFPYNLKMVSCRFYRLLVLL